uniref:Uncharacterized protein n=1 Tax=Chromera velia CCMP2878 TaxID=1169474 RepID=A0A0G4HH92_9ALVE|eukprot:Cvel_6841.t1-p1 / transcript=Cvel_6841.t1 / gene=Cvel_6841 / organism=Chromera_velia_CCMP2878 / gene_product=hypothetical protein / transcript_product=hypothetical protein / location=Cvel_scaffold345:28579-34698(-) / protein_length=1318 / sequence_SO=supercontig / SO=protein_coding / is_pseudo=false
MFPSTCISRNVASASSSVGQGLQGSCRGESARRLFASLNVHPVHGEDPFVRRPGPSDGPASGYVRVSKGQIRPEVPEGSFDRRNTGERWDGGEARFPKLGDGRRRPSEETATSVPPHGDILHDLKSLIRRCPLSSQGIPRRDHLEQWENFFGRASVELRSLKPSQTALLFTSLFHANLRMGRAKQKHRLSRLLLGLVRQLEAEVLFEAQRNGPSLMSFGFKKNDVLLLFSSISRLRPPPGDPIFGFFADFAQRDYDVFTSNELIEALRTFRRAESPHLWPFFDIFERDLVSKSHDLEASGAASVFLMCCGEDGSLSGRTMGRAPFPSPDKKGFRADLAAAMLIRLRDAASEKDKSVYLLGQTFCALSRLSPENARVLSERLGAREHRHSPSLEEGDGAFVGGISHARRGGAREDTAPLNALVSFLCRRIREGADSIPPPVLSLIPINLFRSRFLSRMLSPPDRLALVDAVAAAAVRKMGGRDSAPQEVGLPEEWGGGVVSDSSGFSSDAFLNPASSSSSTSPFDSLQSHSVTAVGVGEVGVWGEEKVPEEGGGRRSGPPRKALATEALGLHGLSVLLLGLARTGHQRPSTFEHFAPSVLEALQLASPSAGPLSRGRSNSRTAEGGRWEDEEGGGMEEAEEGGGGRRKTEISPFALILKSLTDAYAMACWKTSDATALSLFSRLAVLCTEEMERGNFNYESVCFTLKAFSVALKGQSELVALGVKGLGRERDRSVSLMRQQMLKDAGAALRKIGKGLEGQLRGPGMYKEALSALLLATGRASSLFSASLLREAVETLLELDERGGREGEGGKERGSGREWNGGSEAVGVMESWKGGGNRGGMSGEHLVGAFSAIAAHETSSGLWRDLGGRLSSVLSRLLESNGSDICGQGQGRRPLLFSTIELVRILQAYRTHSEVPPPSLVRTTARRLHDVDATAALAQLQARESDELPGSHNPNGMEGRPTTAVARRSIHKASAVRRLEVDADIYSVLNNYCRFLDSCAELSIDPEEGQRIVGKESTRQIESRHTMKHLQRVRELLDHAEAQERFEEAVAERKEGAVRERELVGLAAERRREWESGFKRVLRDSACLAALWGDSRCLASALNWVGRLGGLAREASGEGWRRRQTNAGGPGGQSGTGRVGGLTFNRLENACLARAFLCLQLGLSGPPSSSSSSSPSLPSENWTSCFEPTALKCLLRGATAHAVGLSRHSGPQKAITREDFQDSSGQLSAMGLRGDDSEVEGGLPAARWASGALEGGGIFHVDGCTTPDGKANAKTGFDHVEVSATMASLGVAHSSEQAAGVFLIDVLISPTNTSITNS